MQEYDKVLKGEKTLDEALAEYQLKGQETLDRLNQQYNENNGEQSSTEEGSEG